MNGKIKIDLEETIRKKVKKTQKSLGCIVFPMKLFAFISILLCVVLNIFTWKNTKSFNLMMPIIFSEGIFILVMFVIFKVISLVISKRNEIGKSGDSVLVEIIEAVIINTYMETDVNFMPDTRRFDRECFFEMEILGEFVKLRVGIDSYKKHNKGDNVYLIKINDSFYGDLIFDKEQYYLDDMGLKAINKKLRVII